MLYKKVSNGMTVIDFYMCYNIVEKKVVIVIYWKLEYNGGL